jgi:SAM-dependent methyltransferase
MSARAKTTYDQIGRTYKATRRSDPRLAAAIWRSLGDARRVLNVGAGTGAYEPPDRAVVALEPSGVMIAQRPPAAAPVLQGSAESLPFEDESFDAVMTVLSDHHWQDRARALSELGRVARSRVVLFNADPAQAEQFWLTSEYLPGFLELIPDRYREPGAWISDTEAALGARIEIEPVLIPHDCQDGFYGAFWQRPHAYLEERVREGISVFARLDRHEVGGALVRLRDDLASGRWQVRHATLAGLDALDLGYAMLVAELD